MKENTVLERELRHLRRYLRTTCAFTLVYEDGLVKRFENEPCHASLATTSNKKISYILDAITTSLVEGEEYKGVYYKDVIWMDYLLSCQLYKGIKLIGTREENYSRSVLQLSSDCPGNLLVSFCIARRMSAENPQIIDMFCYLVEIGIEKDIAFIYSHMFVLTPDGSGVDLVIPDSAHVAIALEKMCAKSFQAFLKNGVVSPENLVQPLGISPYYGPISSLVTASGFVDNNIYVEALVLMEEFYTAPIRKPPLFYTPKMGNTRRISEDILPYFNELTSILLEEK